MVHIAHTEASSTEGWLQWISGSGLPGRVMHVTGTADAGDW